MAHKKFYITTSHRLVCTPNFGVIKYSVFTYSGYCSSTSGVLFRILLLDWLFNPLCYLMSIKFFPLKYSDLPVKFAAVCGNAYKSVKRGGQLWLHNIVSVTHRITKETSLINLKLIKAYKYLVSYSIFFIKYALALKIIWRLKNCCGRYLLERLIHSVLSKPALCNQERTTLFKM